MSEETVIFFEKVGRSNTDKVLEVSKRYATVHNIRTILVASSSGQTAVDTCTIFPPNEYNVVIIASHAGFHAPGQFDFIPENQKFVEEQGAKILVASHALSGIERSIRHELGTWMPLELFAKVLRLFGEGTKVCVEITVMASDANLVPMDGNDIIAIGGSGKGADTAWVIRPAHSNNFFNLKLRKLLCKPML